LWQGQSANPTLSCQNLEDACETVSFVAGSIMTARSATFNTGLDPFRWTSRPALEPLIT